MSEQDFQVGDVVYVSRQGNVEARAKVERLTKTQVIVKNARGVESKYRRSDGQAVGLSAWEASSIRKPNPHLDRQWKSVLLRVSSRKLTQALGTGDISLIRAAIANWEARAKAVEEAQS